MLYETTGLILCLVAQHGPGAGTTVKECNNCQMLQKPPAQTPMHPWEWLQRLWSRLHINCAGSFLGKMFLVTVDAHSKWIEGDIVDSATSMGTIWKLRQMFATHGIPAETQSVTMVPYLLVKNSSNLSR